MLEHFEFFMNELRTKPETIENIHRRISTTVDLNSLARHEGAYAKERGNVTLSSLCSDSRRVTPGAAFLLDFFIPVTMIFFFRSSICADFASEAFISPEIFFPA